MQANSLQAQADQLQAQGDALQKQADSLKAQAAALEKQKDALLQLQATAKQQQQEAEALHDQLVKTITKAGGDDRGTDPRLVKLQDGLIAVKADTLVAPPSISSQGSAATFTVIASTAPSAPATADLVRHLRSTVIPDNSEKGVTAYVGGSTASYVDLAATDLRPAAAGDRHRSCCWHPAADGRVPLAADPAPGGDHNLLTAMAAPSAS